METWRRNRKASYLIGALCAIGAFTSAATAQSPGAGQSPMVEAPSGWFGVTLSDDWILDERGKAFFEGYPIVSEVEPGSPAAKAGVMPGDVLMSFNTHDMRGSAFELRKWMKPGDPFVLQLKRNDAVRIVRGTLGVAPAGWRERIVIDLRPSPSEVFEGRTRTATRIAVPSTQRVMTRIPLPSRVPSALIPAFTFGAGVYPFAGMEFTALNEDLRELLGVKPEGVFVTSVMEGTPARISGLRGGDVLLLADGHKLETPVDLVHAIAAAEGKTLRLRIIRRQKPQTLTLRW